MQFQDILYEKRAGIAKITINRPHVYNAFTTNTMKEISEALSDAEFDPAVGVVVLTGAGDKAFCTGGDLKEAAQPGGYSKEMDYWHCAVHRGVRTIPKVGEIFFI
jgi:naphthoate synthase